MNPVAPASSAIPGQSAPGSSLPTSAKGSDAASNPPVDSLNPLAQDSATQKSDLDRSQKLAEAGQVHQLLLSLMKLNSEIEGQGLLEQIA